jgi:hypothetical protein
MILLAGEFLRGDDGRFNTSLESIALRFFPLKAIGLGTYGANILARKIVDRNVVTILLSVILPMTFALTYSSLSLSEIKRSDAIQWESEQQLLNALMHGDAMARKKLSAVYGARVELMKNCGPLIERPNQPNPTEAEVQAAKACLDAYANRVWFHNFPLPPIPVLVRRLIEARDWDHLSLAASLAVIPVFGTWYVLSLLILVASEYARRFGVKSFVLPLGFALTATGQVIRLIIAMVG